MKVPYLPLFWKFTIAILITVTIFGSINIFLILSDVTHSLQDESQKRVTVVARNLANIATDFLLYEDYVSLQNLVDRLRLSDSTVAYAFILDRRNNILVHNFKDKVPEKVLEANSITAENRESVRILWAKSVYGQVIRDVALPLLGGEIGSVRVGVYEDIIMSELRSTLNSFSYMVFAFLLVGILGAFIFAHIITKPIKTISQISDSLDLDTLTMSLPKQPKKRNAIIKWFADRFRVRDELDFLEEKFYNMIKRLEKAYIELDSTYTKFGQSEKLASIGTLAAGIAHEINNPIAGLQNCIRRILAKPENIEQNKKYLRMMEDATNKIETVVRGLLDYSRPQEMRFEKISISEVIEKSLLLISYKIKKHHINVVNTGPGSERYISGSKNHLEQVFVNLLLNSIDAINTNFEKNPNSKKSITINSAIENETIVINISDTGIGIDKDFIENIFDPFYTTKGIGKGTGLGLSVVYSIIKSHKGSIEVDSQYRHSTNFRITLPL